MLVFFLCFAFLDHILYFSQPVRVGWWWVDSTLEVWETVVFLRKSIFSFEKSSSWPEPAPAWRLGPARQKYSSTSRNIPQCYLFSDWEVMVSCFPGEQNKEDRWAEVQKKITPWRLGIQEQEPELQLVPQQRAARLGKLHGALLVVASLIDKPTNLGGQE